MKEIKITNIIELPVEELSDSCEIRYLGNIDKDGFVLNGSDNILFCNYNGEVIKKIPVQKGSFGIDNLTCNFSHQKDQKGNWEVVLTLYKMSEGKLIQDVFTCPLKSRYGFAFDGFLKTCHVRTDELGRHIITYYDDQWNEEYFLPQKTIDQYAKKGADLIEANVKEDVLAFVSKEKGDIYFFNYKEEKEVNHLQLPFKGSFNCSFFSDNLQWYITFETEGAKKNLYAYDLSTQKAEISKKNIVDFELDDDHEKVVFIQPNNSIEIYDFFSMTLLTKRKFLKKEIDLLQDNFKMKFSQEADRLLLSNNEDLFVLEWSENAVEYVAPSRPDFSKVVADFCQRVETWEEDDVKRVWEEVSKMPKKEKRKVIKEFEKRYSGLLGEDHEFWK